MDAVGSKDGIQIYAHQVEKILLVPAGNGVHGFIGKGDGVQKGVHGALHQVHKGLFHRVFFRTAQHTVLQNVEHARIVLGQGLEGYGKKLVHFSVIHPAQLRPGFIMGHLIQRAGKLFCLPCPGHRKAVQFLSNRQFHKNLLGFFPIHTIL